MEESRLFAQLYPGLRRFAAVVGPTEVDPDDLAQEAVARVLRHHRLTELNDQRVGDLVVMGDGPVYYVAVAERVTVADAEYVGVSAYRMIETGDGLKISEHDWVGNL